MDLHVEDEEGLARALLECRRLGRLNREYVEKPAEDCVHGEERRRHPTAPPQEVPAAEPEPRRQTPCLREDPLLHLPLGGRLRLRREFLVRDEPGWERHLSAQAPAHTGTHTKRVAILNGHERLLHFSHPRVALHTSLRSMMLRQAGDHEQAHAIQAVPAGAAAAAGAEGGREPGRCVQEMRPLFCYSGV
jgi:hypothetical protein